MKGAIRILYTFYQKIVGQVFIDDLMTYTIDHYTRPINPKVNTMSTLAYFCACANSNAIEEHKFSYG